MKGIRLLYDNARPHASNQTKAWVQKYNWEVIVHPLHSPDLNSSDFHLFGLLKVDKAHRRLSLNIGDDYVVK